MLAAVFKGIGNIVVEDVPLPDIEEGDLLIKVKMSSICGTDRKIYKYGHRKIKEGREQILGHEISGVIEAAGSDVSYYEEGMRVVIAPNVGCGHCPACNRGLEQLCPDYNAFGIGWPGGFAEYLRIPAAVVKKGNVMVLPDKLSFEEAAVIEPLSCCYNAYQAMDIKAGDSMLIFGAGPMGILHLILNKYLGIGQTIVADIDQTRLQISKEMGADHILLNDDHLGHKIMELTAGRGVDNIITAAPVSVIQEQALELAAVNGNISFFAGLPSGQEEINFNSNTVHYKQLRVTGTTGASLQQFRRTVKLAESDDLDLKRIVTKKVCLKALEDIFEKPEVFSENIKIVVDMEH
ncbi:MAG: alcohol dehydrogenase catalytic domain-containing protein [Halanaerobiales bacterium]